MLHGLGIRKGDRVAVQLPKRMEFLFLHFATLSLGAVTLPLSSDYRAEEAKYFLDLSRGLAGVSGAYQRPTGRRPTKPPHGELAALCKDRLAGYKCPKQLHYLDALPRNAMGKIQKNALVERYR